MDKVFLRALDSLSPRGRSVDRLLGPEDFLQLTCDEVSRALRYDRPLSVALISMDRLNVVRKEGGRRLAEGLARAATEAVIERLRRLDRVARLSPGDLGVLMPETTLANAGAVMERLRRSVEHQVIETASGDRQMTLSIGVVGLTPRMRDPKAFLMRACFELRRAQSKGRNTVCLAAPDTVKMTTPPSGQVH